jgi:chromate reductase
MAQKKKILAICGSTRSNSSNLNLLKAIAELTKEIYVFNIFEDLARIPSFNPDADGDNTPIQVIDFRKKISDSDAVIICSPEYVFSMPGSLKNALEWTVSTTVFSHKPVGLITASADGEKGHEQLMLVMKTIDAKFNDATQLLIRGIRSKISPAGEVVDETTINELKKFLEAFNNLLN